MTENIIPEKPFLTYDEMIHKLKNKYNLLIYDDDIAKQNLQTLTYYNLINGYQECFRNSTTDKFIDGISMDFLCQFHYFDKNFQHIFLEYCTYIEDTFKNHVSYVVSKDFGVTMNEYLNPDNYVLPKKYNKRSKTVYTTIKNIRKKIDAKKLYILDNPSKYYLENHNHIPAWILFKNTAFTDVIDLYSFMKSEQKNQVINFMFPSFPLEIGPQKEFLKISITLVRKFRNRIAHNLKYYAFRPDNTYFSKSLLRPIAETTPLLTSQEVEQQIRGKNDVYAFFISLIFLLGSNDLLKNMFEDIILLLRMDQHNSLEQKREPLFNSYSKITGLPLNLEDRILHYYHNQF